MLDTFPAPFGGEEHVNESHPSTRRVIALGHVHSWLNNIKVCPVWPAGSGAGTVVSKRSNYPGPGGTNRFPQTFERPLAN